MHRKCKYGTFNEYYFLSSSRKKAIIYTFMCKMKHRLNNCWGQLDCFNKRECTEFMLKLSPWESLILGSLWEPPAKNSMSKITKRLIWHDLVIIKHTEGSPPRCTWEIVCFPLIGAEEETVFLPMSPRKALSPTKQTQRNTK